MTVEQLYDKLADLLGNGYGKAEVVATGSVGSIAPDEVVLQEFEGVNVVELKEKEN